MRCALLLLALNAANAQDETEAVGTEEVASAPVEDTIEDAPAEGAAEGAAEDPFEDATEQPAEAVEAVEAVAEPAAEEEVPPEADLGYRQGFDAGQEDAKRARDYALHGLAGFGAGCLVGPCGCVAVPAIEAVVVPGVPSGPWQGYGDTYQQGYTEGYRRAVTRRRVVISLAGASVGTVIGVGAGLAFGAFAL